MNEAGDVCLSNIMIVVQLNDRIFAIIIVFNFTHHMIFFKLGYYSVKFRLITMMSIELITGNMIAG